MSEESTIIIIGGGISGVHGAETLRKEGYQGQLILIERDNYLPYDRPPLSKSWLTEEANDANVLLRDPEFYENQNIDLKLNTEVTTINPVDKTIFTKNGSSYEWNKLLIATGSNLRTTSIEGGDLNGIFYLRKMADAISIKQHVQLQHVKKAVIIGAGFIGAEMASSLKQMGIEITIVSRSSYPMKNIVGSDVSSYLLDLHRRHGTEVITNDTVSQFIGDTTVHEVLTAEGRRISCQMVIMGTGVTPNTELSHPQLQTAEGYTVNEYGQTSITDVYAAGDCTSWPHQGNIIHVEHWDHAVNHAKAVAQNMIHSNASPYVNTPYFWSDQYDFRFQYLGYTKSWSKVVQRRSDENAFTCFYMNNKNVIKAALVFNQPKNTLPVRKMIRKQEPMNPGDLADVTIPLKKVKIDSGKVE